MQNNINKILLVLRKALIQSVNPKFILYATLYVRQAIVKISFIKNIYFEKRDDHSLRTCRKEKNYNSQIHKKSFSTIQIRHFFLVINYFRNSLFIRTKALTAQM